MECKHCGSTLDKSTVKYCPYCGKQVASGETVSSRGNESADVRSFSETAWFMSAVTPESLEESEGEALDYGKKDEMNERYELEQKLPNAVRKEFSLKTIPPGEAPAAAILDD